MRWFVVVFAALFVFSCAEEEDRSPVEVEPPFPGIIGIWDGELKSVFDEPFQLQLVIDSTWEDSSFGGTVWSYHPGWDKEFNGFLIGWFHFPDTIEIEIAFSGFVPFYLRGRFPSYNLIIGGAWESGFMGEEWFLNRDLTVRKDVQIYSLTSPLDPGVRNWAEGPRRGP